MKLNALEGNLYYAIAVLLVLAAWIAIGAKDPWYQVALPLGTAGFIIIYKQIAFYQSMNKQKANSNENKE